MLKISGKTYDEERALYGVFGAKIEKCSFDGPLDGESALKESGDIFVNGCYFNLRYPLWHVRNATVINSEMTEKCRAALWYDKNITLKNCVMNGIKALRECEDVSLIGSRVNSPEFLWRCRGVRIVRSSIASEYPFFECRDLDIERLKLDGKYSFQYAENAEIRNSVLNTKDAFWHSRNVTVYDSVIRGEYLGWYSENLHLVRCRIIGTQPLCYCRGLVLEDCTMSKTDLAFERSEVRATVKGRIESVKNPLCGYVKADRIGTLILEEQYIDRSMTEIDAQITKKEVTPGEGVRTCTKI